MSLSEKYLNIGYTLGRSSVTLPFKLSPLHSGGNITESASGVNSGLSPSDSLSLLIGWILSLKMKSSRIA